MNIQDIKLSVAVLTKDRPLLLNTALESIRSQSCQPFEIVVSDDSQMAYQEEVERIAKLWHCKYVRGPQRGLYANRNNAAVVCRGTHVRTMDDDHRLPPGHLEACFQAIQDDPGSLWTTGEIGYVNGQKVAMLERANQLHPSGLGCLVENTNDNWAIADGSTIYPASVFQAGYRMVEWYGYGPSYLEFGAYLYCRGYKSRCLPGLVVEHYAGDATLGRANEAKSIVSQLFASLCYNLYFSPNRLSALKYTLACLKQSKDKLTLACMIPKTVARVRARWEG